MQKLLHEQEILSKQIQVKEQGLILPVMDARRDEVYCAVYDSSYNLIKKDVTKIINQESFSELENGVEYCGYPCVVKPLMSSSGKGQSVIKTPSDIQKAWDHALEGSRGDLLEVIVEGFIDFEYEITLLTVTQKNGSTLFCPPIGHRQERGDYQESWQPMPMDKERLEEAQEMAKKVTGEHEGKLEGHLKSDDFFSVDKFPKASLIITKSEMKMQNHYISLSEISHRINLCFAF